MGSITEKFLYLQKVIKGNPKMMLPQIYRRWTICRLNNFKGGRSINMDDSWPKLIMLFPKTGQLPNEIDMKKNNPKDN
jgi:hypothetical protein